MGEGGREVVPVLWDVCGIIFWFSPCACITLKFIYIYTHTYVQICNVYLHIFKPTNICLWHEEGFRLWQGKRILSVHVCYNVPLLFRHTVPSCRGEDAKGKDRGWYEAALRDGNPIIVYLHGSAEHRSVPLLGFFFFSFKERGSVSARWGKGRRSSVFDSVTVLPHLSFFSFVEIWGCSGNRFLFKKSICSVWRLMLIFNWKGD